MKNLILFTIFSFIKIMLCIGQDNQWYIKDGNIKTGFNGTYNTYTSPITSIGILCNSNTFSIDGVTHPNTSISGAANDVFVIYNDGTYYNSRNLGYSPFAGYNGGTSYSIVSSHCSTIKDLYFTNIYQGDDPPSNVSLSNNTGNYQVNIDSYSPPLSITADHDIVPGADITIILPRDSMQYYQSNCGGIFTMTFDDALLDPSYAFNNNTDFSFVNGPTYSYSGCGLISNISIPTHNHFLNFKVASTLPQGYNIGDLVTFRLRCGSQLVGTLSERIQNLHDPNYIQVKCIYLSNGKYHVMYHVEFMNDGTLGVHTVAVSLKLPNLVTNSSSIQVSNWAYGLVTGCGQKPGRLILDKYNFKEIKFVFLQDPSQSLGLAANVSSIGKNEKTGWVDFCVELNATSVNQIQQADLTIADPTTSFDGTTYGITHFIDPKKWNDNTKRNDRPISSNCHCFCNKTVPTTR